AAHQILGGRHDRQPVRPAVALEQLVRLVAVGDLVRRRPERRRVHRRHAVRRSPLSAPLLGPSRDLRWGSIPVPPNVTGRRSLRYHAFHRSGPRSTAPPVAPSRRRFAMSSGGSAVTALTSATPPASTPSRLLSAGPSDLDPVFCPESYNAPEMPGIVRAER